MVRTTLPPPAPTPTRGTHRRKLVLALAAVLALTTLTAPTATARPLPVLDLEIQRVTTSAVVVEIVCPVDPPARITAGATGVGQLVLFEPVDCLRDRKQRFVIPLDAGVTPTRGQLLAEVTIQFSGDSGEMNNLYHDVRVGQRLHGGELL